MGKHFCKLNCFHKFANLCHNIKECNYCFVHKFPFMWQRYVRCLCKITRFNPKQRNKLSGVFELPNWQTSKKLSYKFTECRDYCWCRARPTWFNTICICMRAWQCKRMCESGNVCMCVCVCWCACACASSPAACTLITRPDRWCDMQWEGDELAHTL